ncbi:hypothetical protein QGC_1437, partial [Clostridioides difficile CD196]
SFDNLKTVYLWTFLGLKVILIILEVTKKLHKFGKL